MNQTNSAPTDLEFGPVSEMSSRTDSNHLTFAIVRVRRALLGLHVVETFGRIPLPPDSPEYVTAFRRYQCDSAKCAFMHSQPRTRQPVVALTKRSSSASRIRRSFEWPPIGTPM